MKGLYRLVTSGEDLNKQSSETFLEKLSERLLKSGLGYNTTERYRKIMSYSDVLDYMNFQFMISLIITLYNNNEEDIDVIYFVQNNLGSRSSYKESEYKTIFLRTIVDTERYLQHFYKCRDRAGDSVQSLSDVKEMDIGYSPDEALFNEFD